MSTGITQTFLFSCIILFLNFIISQSILFNGLEYREMYSNDAVFIADTAYWGISSQVASLKYTDCGGTYILGGYNVLGTSSAQYLSYFRRYYSSLPAHNMIRFSLTFYALDTWDGGKDGFYFYFDAREIDNFWHFTYTSFPAQVCGTSYADLANMRIFGILKHTSSTLDFRMVSTLDSQPADESWGLRNFNILFDKNPVVSENICGRASITLPASQCTCAEGYYYDGSTCQVCHTNCASCYGSAASQCYQCKQTGGYSFDGYQCIACSTRCDTCFGTASNQCSTCTSGSIYYPANYQCLAACPYPLDIISGQCYSPCSTITDYIYWDKSCASTCPSPFQSTTIPTVPTLKLCIFPCSAQDFLYWDGSCRSDCSSPLVQSVNRNFRLCTTPCALTQYLYPDGSCYSVCDLPLLKKFYKDQNFCVSPCNVPGQYLYANGECVSSCVNPPFTPTTIMGIDYCIYPCVGTSNYLYWNGSCYSECKFPNLVRITHNEQYCDYPTNTANWLYWDGTEHTTCDLPLLQRIETAPDRNYCDFKCMIYEYLYWNGTCSTECIFPLSKRLSNGRRFCDYPCSGTDTLYWNGSCLPSSTCNLPLLTRNDLGTLYCEFPDGDITQYLYWDGTFASTCDYPLFARIEGSPMVRKFCDFICNSPTPYLYWDQTCGASCTPSTAITETITGGKLMCIFPCRDLFLLFNGSCVETCDLPFTQVIQGIGKYCNHPCASTSNNNYYYWNGVCKSVCPPPLQVYTTDGTLEWCIYPCEGSMSLYSNGTCAEGCNAPFRKNIGLDGMNYCVNPCLPSEYYVTWNETCSSSCPYPYVIDDTNMGTLCQLPCSEEFEFLDQNTGECITECDRDSSKIDDAYMLCLTDPTDYSSALDILLESSSGGSRHTLVTLNKMLQYVRYLDIKMPPRLQYLAYNQDSSILSLRFPAKMSADLQEHFTMNSIPKVYEKYGLHSNFLVNFWQEMCNWIVFAILGLIFTALEASCKRFAWSTFERFFEKLRIITKWNLLLVLLGTSVDDIVLFGVLHLRSLKLNSALAGLSFEVCLLAVCILNILIFATYYFVKQQKRNLAFQSQVRYFEFLKTYNGYQVLYQGFRQNNPLNRGFYLVYIIRFLLPSLVASVLWFSPVAQTVFYVLISLVSLPYIWIARPMRRKLDHVQLVVLESFILVINCCLFGLVICSNMNKSSSYSAIMMADIVVGLNSGITILFIVVLILKILQGIKILWKSHKAQQQEIFSKIDRTEWLQLLVYFLQQGGMGFETIYVNPEGGFKAEIYHEMEEAVKEIRKKDKIEELRKEVSSLRALAEETKALKTPKPQAKTEILPDLTPTHHTPHRIGGRFSQPQSVQKPSTAITDITRGLSHDEFSSYGVEVAERPDTGNNLHAESTLIPVSNQSQWNEVPGGTFSHLGSHFGSRRDSALFLDE